MEYILRVLEDADGFESKKYPGHHKGREGKFPDIKVGFILQPDCLGYLIGEKTHQKNKGQNPVNEKGQDGYNAT